MGVFHRHGIHALVMHIDLSADHTQRLFFSRVGGVITIGFLIYTIRHPESITTH